MKTTYKLLIILFAILTSYACEKIEVEPITLEVYSTNLWFKSIGETRTVKAKAPEIPTLTYPDWINVIVNEGKNKFEYEIVMFTEVNMTNDKKTGIVSVMCQDKTAIINVTQNEQSQPSPKDTPEVILTSVQSIYTIESCEQTDNQIIVVFHDPMPVDLNGKYSDGIPSVTVNKSDLMNFNENENEVTFDFKSGEKAIIRKHKQPLDTPQSILVYLQDKYTLYSVRETERTITIIFHDPVPVTLNEDYPNGIKSVVVNREDIKEFIDDASYVKFVFNNNQKAVIKTASIPMELTLSENSIDELASKAIDPTDPHSESIKTKKMIDFTVACARPENLIIEIEDSKYFIIQNPDGSTTKWCSTKTEVEFNPETSSGVLTVESDFTINDGEYGTLYFTIKNGYKSKTEKISYIFRPEHRGLTLEQIREGLIALYNSCNGPNWEKQENWCTDAPLKDWQGVSISSYSPYTIGINIVDPQNFKGVIPDEFWNICKQATSICFRGDLSGSKVPEYVWHQDLIYINIYESNIAVNINDIHKAKNIGYVDVSSCYAEDLTEFFNHQYPKLDILSIMFEEPTQVPSNIGNLAKNAPELESLGLYNTTGKYQESAFDISQLIILDIQGETTGNISPKIGNMKRLTSLRFPKYLSNGVVPNEMGNCKYLKEICFGDFRYIHEYAEAIKHIPFSWNLGFTSCGIAQLFYYQLDENGKKIYIDTPSWLLEHRFDSPWMDRTWQAEWPNAGDLEHPADEIFWVDGQWQHRPDMKYEADNSLSLY